MEAETREDDLGGVEEGEGAAEEERLGLHVDDGRSLVKTATSSAKKMTDEY